jgi:diguanylate cyclase (GGDEF)-like protein
MPGADERPEDRIAGKAVNTLALDAARTHHWVVVNSYRVRIAACALVALPIALHVLPRLPGGLFWLVFLTQFFAYPHLVQWRTRRAVDHEKAEFQNLAIDAFCFGAWTAGLGFPLWISVALFLATLLNHAITRGVNGVVLCPVAFLAGALASTTVIAFHVSTDTSGLVTLSSIIGLSIYTSLMGIEFFSYIRRLREVQAAVATQKQTLEEANQALHEQISQIHDLQEKLREQANRDSLTGLFNRRYLEGTLERELSRCKREGTPLTMLLLDIDHFKLVNDTYGHPAGDEVLRVFARVLQESARAEDIVCRYGGEEFLLVLPKMPLAIARARAALLLETFRKTPVDFEARRIRVTTSIGIASVPGHGTTVQELVRSADQALYRAKSGGRDRVVVFGEG